VASALVAAANGGDDCRVVLWAADSSLLPYNRHAPLETLSGEPPNQRRQADVTHVARPARTSFTSWPTTPGGAHRQAGVDGVRQTLLMLAES